MRKFVFSGVAAGLIGGAMLLSGTSPASAATLPSPALTAPGDTAMVEEVQRRRGDRVHRYDRSRHGPRYRTVRPGYRHYYGGYYYSSPWWHGPGFGFGITVPGFSFGLTAPGVGLPAAHVQWCMNRYRTYDPATDTYIPRVGQRARCSSPYVPW
jgi:hypothetical protein